MIGEDAHLRALAGQPPRLLLPVPLGHPHQRQQPAADGRHPLPVNRDAGAAYPLYYHSHAASILAPPITLSPPGRRSKEGGRKPRGPSLFLLSPFSFPLSVFPV